MPINRNHRPGLPEHCAEDIQTFCAAEHASKSEDAGGALEGSFPGLVLECLSEKRKQLSPRCVDDLAPVVETKVSA